jgi:hypothetical protein
MSRKEIMSKNKLTVIVLGAFLILSGLVGLVGGLGGLGLVIAILAIAAGILLLLFTPGVSNRIGWVLAAIYLLVIGLIGLLNFSFPSMGIVLAILALAAGILLIIQMGRIKGSVGYLLFYIWLILVGLVGLVSLGPLGMVIDLVALAAGILIILGV